jgi:pilus assembly protein CpaC
MAAALAEDTLKVFELNGFIILEGQVPNEYRRLRAERIAATFQVPLIALIEVEAPQTERQAELDERVGADRKSQPIVEPSSALAGETEAQSGGSDPMPVSEPRLEEESQSNHVEEKMKSHLGEEIASTIGLPGVQVQMVKGAAVLDGTVSNELEAQGAAAIAGLFADVVINRLQVLPETGVPGPPLTEMVSDILNLPGVRVSQAGDKLLLEGVVDDQAEQERAVRVAGAFGKEVISFIKVEAPLQVLLKVRVVEASRVDMDRIGISWGSLERGVFIPDVVEIGELIIGEPLERLLPIGAKLEALIDEGKARLLAAPSLLTLSGREAEFLSGGEIPVIVPKDGELQINWKAYGVKLKILPVVVDEQSIEVRVEPEVSTLDWANAIRIESLALPAMKTRRTDTTVRINDGTTFVISGLLENSEALQVHKLPLLGDLPIIGKLFRSEQFMTDQTELIFFVTPYILKGNAPANNQELWRDEIIEGREGPIDAPAITPANSR